MTQWHKPLRANSSYAEQATRLLSFIKSTKFGFISLQRVFRKLGIGCELNESRYRIRLSSYNAVEVYDVEDCTSLLIYAQYQLADQDAPFKVILDPPIGSLNQVL
jgi:hypothetical protein